MVLRILVRNRSFFTNPPYLLNIRPIAQKCQSKKSFYALYSSIMRNKSHIAPETFHTDKVVRRCLKCLEYCFVFSHFRWMFLVSRRLSAQKIICLLELWQVCPTLASLPRALFKSVIYYIYRGFCGRAWSLLVSWSGWTTVCFSRDGLRLVFEW